MKQRDIDHGTEGASPPWRRSSPAPVAMSADVELFRDLLFMLETYQTSPRSVIVVSAELETESLGRPPSEIEEGLATLLDYDYIDGPGPDEPGFFLFRKVTRKGLEFIKASRHPRDWEDLKRHYAERQLDAP